MTLLAGAAPQVWVPKRRVRRYTLDDVAGDPKHWDPADLVKIGRNTKIGSGVKLGRSGVAAGPGATDPLTIVTSVTCAWFFSADVGITIGTGVSAWADQSANAYSAVQATGGDQPALQAAALNGRNTILFDGAGDRLTIGTWDPSAPGTTNYWMFFVFRHVTDAANARLACGTSAADMRIGRSTSTTFAVSNGTTSANVNRTVATWYRAEVLWANSASLDYFKIGANSTGAGTAFGNSNLAAGTFTFGAQPGGTNPGNVELACAGCWSGAGGPNGTEKGNLDAWVTSYYGGSVGV